MIASIYDFLGYQQTATSGIHKAKKRKLLCSPQVGFLNFGVGQKMIFFFKKHPKVQNFGAFSIFFLQKGEKAPNMTKIGCIPDPNFSYFIF